MVNENNDTWFLDKYSFNDSKDDYPLKIKSIYLKILSKERIKFIYCGTVLIMEN